MRLCRPGCNYEPLRLPYVAPTFSTVLRAYERVKYGRVRKLLRYVQDYIVPSYEDGLGTVSCESLFGLVVPWAVLGEARLKRVG